MALNSTNSTSEGKATQKTSAGLSVSPASTRFTPGVPSSTKFTLWNVSRAPIRIRFIPPTHPEYTLSSIKPAILSPGLQMTVDVTYNPDASLSATGAAGASALPGGSDSANASSFTVLTPQGSLVIPLLAAAAEPRIKVATVVDFGTLRVETTASAVLKLISECSEPVRVHLAAVTAPQGAQGRSAPRLFQVVPSDVVVPPGSKGVSVRVIMTTGITTGRCDGACHIACKVKLLGDLTGTVSPGVGVSQVATKESAPQASIDVAQKPKEMQTIGAAGGVVKAQVVVSTARLSLLRPLGPHDPVPAGAELLEHGGKRYVTTVGLDAGVIPARVRTSKQLYLHNPTPCPVKYNILSVSSRCTGALYNGSQVLRSKTDDEASPVTLSPIQAVVAPDEVAALAAVLHPCPYRPPTGWFKQTATTDPPTGEIVTDFSIDIVDLNGEDTTDQSHVASSVCFSVTSKVVPAVLQLSTPFLQFGTLAISAASKVPTTKKTLSLTAHNPSDISMPVAVSTPPQYYVTPNKTAVPPRSSVNFEVMFAPTHFGHAVGKLLFTVAGVEEFVVSLKGRATGSPAEGDAAAKTSAVASKSAIAPSKAAGPSKHTPPPHDGPDLGMEFDHDSAPAAPALPFHRDPLWVLDASRLRGLQKEAAALVKVQEGDIDGQNETSEGDMPLPTRQLTLISAPSIAKVYPKEPSNAREAREVQRPLPPSENRFRVFPQTLDLGSICVDSNVTKPFYVANDSSGSILVELPLGGKDGNRAGRVRAELQGTGPASMVIPAHSVGVFHLVVCCTSPQVFQESLAIVVNSQARIRLTVYADVVPLAVTPSATTLSLFLPDTSTDPSVSIPFTVTSKSDVYMGLTWAIRKPPLETDRSSKNNNISSADIGSCFSVSPPAVLLPPHGTVRMMASFQPCTGMPRNAEVTVDMLARTLVKPADKQAADRAIASFLAEASVAPMNTVSSICLRGAFAESNVTTQERRVDFGSVAIGSVTTQTVTLRNPDPTPSVVFVGVTAGAAKQKQKRDAPERFPDEIVTATTLIGGVTVSPSRLRIPPGDSATVTLVYNAGNIVGSWSGAVVFVPRGGRAPVRLPIHAATSVANISLRAAPNLSSSSSGVRARFAEQPNTKEVVLDTVFVGSRVTATLEAVNHSSIHTAVNISLLNQPDFRIGNARGTEVTEYAPWLAHKHLTANPAEVARLSMAANLPQILVTSHTNYAAGGCHSVSSCSSADTAVEHDSEVSEGERDASTHSAADDLGSEHDSGVYDADLLSASSSQVSLPSAVHLEEDQPSCGVSYLMQLPPNSTATFTLIFQPTSPGSHNFPLTISLAHAQDNLGSDSINVATVATRPRLRLSTTSLDFGSVVVYGLRSARDQQRKVVRLTNSSNDAGALTWSIGAPVAKAARSQGKLNQADGTGVSHPEGEVDMNSNNKRTIVGNAVVSTSAQLPDEVYEGTNSRAHALGERSPHSSKESLAANASSPKLKSALKNENNKKSKLDTEHFSVNPSSGRLEPGASCLVDVQFLPFSVGEYSTLLPIFLDSDEPYVSLMLKGSGTYPSVSFEPPSLSVPVVPPNTVVKTEFSVINNGYDMVEMRCICPAVDKGAVPVTFSFPSGTTLGPSRSSFPVEVTYSPTLESKALCPSMNLAVDFVDSEKNRFTMYINLGTSASVLSNFPFSRYILGPSKNPLRRNRRRLSTVDGAAHQGAPVVDLRVYEPTRARRVSEGEMSILSLRSSDLRVDKGNSSMLSTAKALRKAFHQRAAPILKRWITANVLPALDEGPFDTVFTSGHARRAVSFLEAISGASLPLNAPPVDEARSDNSFRAAVTDFVRMQQILHFLKAHGASLHFVDPQYLLDKTSFNAISGPLFLYQREQNVLITASTPLSQVPPDQSGDSDRMVANLVTDLLSALKHSTSGQLVSAGLSNTAPPVIPPHQYSILCHQSWMAVIIESIRIFVFDRRITWKLLASSPVACSHPMLRAALVEGWYTEVPAATSQRPPANATDDATTLTPSPSSSFKLRVSDPYPVETLLGCSVAEGVLLKWLSIHLNAVYGPTLVNVKQAMGDGTSLRKSKGDALKTESFKNSLKNESHKAYQPNTHGCSAQTLASPFHLSVSDFAGDLQDGLAVAAVVSSYLPHTRAGLLSESSGFFVPPRSTSHCESNWNIIIHCLVEIGVIHHSSYPEIGEIGSINMVREMVLFLAVLFFRLPAFLPIVESSEFVGATGKTASGPAATNLVGSLNVSMTHSISFTNHSRTEMQYNLRLLPPPPAPQAVFAELGSNATTLLNAVLDQSNEFPAWFSRRVSAIIAASRTSPYSLANVLTLSTSNFSLKPSATTDIDISVVPRWLQSSAATLLAVPCQSVGTIWAPSALPIVVPIHLQVNPGNSVQQHTVVTAKLYETTTCDIHVTNPFNSSGTFFVNVQNASSPDAPAGTSYPTSLWSPSEPIPLRTNVGGSFQVSFTPYMRQNKVTVPGTSQSATYVTRFLLSDESLGEFIVAVYGVVNPPASQEKHSLSTTVIDSDGSLSPPEPVHKMIVLQSKNPQIEKALTTTVDRARGKRGAPAPPIRDGRQRQAVNMKYTVSSDSSFFTVPKQVVIPADGTVQLKVVFEPVEPGTYEALITLSNPADCRVFSVEGICRLAAAPIEFTFSSPARCSTSQVVPIRAPPSDSIIHAAISGEVWFGPKEVRLGDAPPSYTLTYVAHWPSVRGTVSRSERERVEDKDNKKVAPYSGPINVAALCSAMSTGDAKPYIGRLRLRTANDSANATYQLQGIVRPPLVTGTLTASTRARETVTVAVDVPHIFPRRVDIVYAVHLVMSGGSSNSSVVDTSIIPQSFSISGSLYSNQCSANDTLPFSLPLCPTHAGEHTGTLIMQVIAPQLPDCPGGVQPFIYWDVKLSVSRPPPDTRPEDGPSTMSCPLQQAVTEMVTIRNSCDEEVTFELTVEPPDLLTCPSSVVVSPKNSRQVPLTFAPLSMGRTMAVFSARSNEMGEIWREIELIPLPSEVQELSPLSCDVGSSVSTTITLTNTLNIPIALTSYVQCGDTENPSYIVLSPANLVLSERSSENVTVTFVPIPSLLGSISSVSVVFSDAGAKLEDQPTLGDLRFSLSCRGTAPTRREPVTVSAIVGSSSTVPLTIRNPFPDSVRFLISLHADDEAASNGSGSGTYGPFSLLSKRIVEVAAGAVLTAPVSFAPDNVASFSAVVSITVLPSKDEATMSKSFNTPSDTDSYRPSESQVALRSATANALYWRFSLNAVSQMIMGSIPSPLSPAEGDIAGAGVSPTPLRIVRKSREEARVVFALPAKLAPDVASVPENTAVEVVTWPVELILSEKSSRAVAASVAVSSATRDDYVIQRLGEGHSLPEVEMAGSNKVLAVVYCAVVFAPLKSFSCACTLTIEPPTGGQLIFPITLQALPPAPDDTIRLMSQPTPRSARATAAACFRLPSPLPYPTMVHATFTSDSQPGFSILPAKLEIPASDAPEELHARFTVKWAAAGLARSSVGHKGTLCVVSEDFEWRFTVVVDR